MLPAPGGFNEGTPASCMELGLPRVRCAHGECGGAGNSGAANERKRTLSNSPSRERLAMEEDAVWIKRPFGKVKKRETAAILAQVGIQAPGLSFRCICHLGNPIKTLSSQVFVCCVHRMAPVACRPIIKCGWWNIGYKAGKKPATGGTCGKTFPRPNVTLSDFLPVRSDKKKRNSSRNASPATSRRSRNTSPAMSRRSSVVSWSDSPRDQVAPKSEDAAMEDCTESHQAEINKKIRANDKLRKILTNMPDMNTNRSSTVTVSRRKRQFLPLQSRIEKQKNYLERISNEIETKQQHRLEILQKWVEADQELDAAHAKQIQAKHEMSILVVEQTAENAKGVNQGTPGIQSLSSGSNPDPDAQQTILSVFKSVLSMQSMGCHSVAEQFMASGATDEEVKKISQIMAQTVRQLEVGSTFPEPGLKALKPSCDVVVLDAELPSCIPGFSSMDIEGQEAIKRSLSNAATEKRRLAKKCKQEGDVL